MVLRHLIPAILAMALPLAAEAAGEEPARSASDILKAAKQHQQAALRQTSEAEAAMQAAMKAVERVEAQVASLEERRSAVRQDVDEARAELETLRGRVAEQEATLAELRDRTAAAREAASALESELADRERQAEGMKQRIGAAYAKLGDALEQLQQALPQTPTN